MLQFFHQADGRYSNNKSKLDIKKEGFSWTRLQFLVQPAFLMTLNKAQGQNFRSKVGFYLHKDAFNHGQL